VVLFNICYTPVFIVAIFKKWYRDTEEIPNPPVEHVVVEMRRVNLSQPPNQFQPQIAIPNQGSYGQPMQYKYVPADATMIYSPKQDLANKL
jgi:hypothetical protein